MRNIHQEVTDQIIAKLKNGVRPWIKPWSETPGLNIACNAVIGRPYSGINALLLFKVHGQNSQPRFITFKQAQAAGGSVRKGEHGHMIVFVGNAVKKEQSPGEEPGTYKFLKAYTVFNIAQCDGLPDKLTAMPAGPNKQRRDELLQEFIRQTGARIVEMAASNKAFYSPGSDAITMPLFQMFNDQSSYYATLFHELIHWTGHPSRLEIDGFVPQAAAYIEHFIEVLLEDPRAIFTCASQAQQAVDFLRRRLLADSEAISAAA
jgi:antirestriction protein ArdC